MTDFIQIITDINKEINSLVWGEPMLVLIIATGIYLSIKTGMFQLFKIGHIYKSTIGKLFKSDKKSEAKGKKGITQFQAVSTALAATIGTGSIAGVATAITIGGPGAVFWMWASAFFGMMTAFGENVLGIFYRVKDGEKGWRGGAMYYIEHGLKCRWLAIIFALFCVCASFGMGNMVQSNSVSTSLQATGFMSPSVSGIIMAIIAAGVILGGIKRIGKVSQFLIPIISVLYVVGTMVIILANADQLISTLKNICLQAFGFNAVAGGISGAMIKNAISMGVKRGVFSNEAGLGSAVAVHSAADVKEPVVQGMWGIVEVFVDTMIVCTLTALVILTSGAYSTESTTDGAPLVIEAFEKVLGNMAGGVMTFFIVVFAFATIIGWEYIGEKAMEYIFGSKSVFIYKIIFIAFVYIGAVMNLRLAWDISDTLNGLMAIPNLIALWFLSPLIIKITKNYKARKFKGEKIKAILSSENNPE